MTSLRRRFPILAGAGAAVFLCLLAGACEGPAPAPLAHIHDLTGVPLPEELAEAMAGAIASLEESEPQGKAVDVLEFVEDIEPRIDRPESRSAAAAELAAHLEEDPHEYALIALAWNNSSLLRGHLDVKDLLSHPAYADSARGVGAYLRGKIRFRSGNRGREFLAMNLEDEDPTSLNFFMLVFAQAAALREEGDDQAGIQLLLKHLPASRKAGGARIEARFWGRIASAMSRTDRLDAAVHARTMRIALNHKTGSGYAELSARMGLAATLNRRRELTGAINMIVSCVDSAQAGNHPWLMSRFLNRAAGYYAEAGDLERAYAADLKCLELARAVQDSFNVPVAMTNVAYDLRLLGRLKECRAYLDDGRRWVAAFPDPRLLAGYPLREIPYYLHVGDFAVADSLLRVVSELHPDSQPAVEEAEFHLEQIDFARETGRADLAYRSINRLEDLRYALYGGLADANRLAAYAMATADLFAQQGEFRRAANALQDAAEAVATGGGEGMEWLLARSQGELALHRDDPLEAQQAFARCFDLAEAGSEPAKSAESRFLLGTALIEAGRPAEAVRLLDSGPEDTTFGGRFRIRLSRRLYAAIARVKAGDVRAGIAGLDAVAVECGPYTPPDLRVRLHLELGKALVKIGDLERAEAELAVAVQLMRAADGRVFSADLRLMNRRLRRDLFESVAGFFLDHPRRLEDTDVAHATLALLDLAGTGDMGDASGPAPALWYFVGRERSFRWLRHERGLAVNELPGEVDLARLAAPVVADVRRPERPVDQRALDRLADVLLGRLSVHWQSGHTLHIAPDGLLHAVPWAALSLPTSDGGTESALDRGPIREMAAGAAADVPPPAADGRWLVLGDDRALGEIGGGGKSLRHAEAEARAVAARRPAASVDLRLGAMNDDLDEDDFVGPAVIHIASHARFSQGLGRRATVRFAVGVPLTATGVARRHLGADLIYLSCCESDRPLAAGGVGSFARACLEAGARTVIASGQRIDDEAAAVLARRFYDHWLSGMSKAAALRAAQLQVRVANPDWSHPYYWATYRLIGDPR
ncbi:MAG: CHAT domain-containing protein [bacterium]|nr:CHAT domain-containing protein [bacterium]